MADDNRDETFIRRLVDRWHRATAAGDVAGILALMAEDAVFLVPERPPIRGRAAFAQGIKSALETFSISSIGEVREVGVSGDLAYCWTDLTVTMTPIDGTSATVRTGPALSIFKRGADGEWRLVREANMLASHAAELELKIDNLERELMTDGPGG